jgi:hypothetical protein
MVEKRNFQSLNKDLLIFYFDLYADYIPLAIATNFRGPFDLFRAMWTGFAADAPQIFRKKVKDGERPCGHKRQN